MVPSINYTNSDELRWNYSVHHDALSALSIVRHGASIFSGDSHQFFIYLACLLAAAADTLRNAKSNIGVERRELESNLSVSSVAAMTGIPRETVRRKMIQLLESGFLLAGRDGKYIAHFDDNTVAAIIPLYRR